MTFQQTLQDLTGLNIIDRAKGQFIPMTAAVSETYFYCQIILLATIKNALMNYFFIDSLLLLQDSNINLIF